MTKPTPKESITEDKTQEDFVCPRCREVSSIESGGSYERQVRDLAGKRVERVRRYRCSKCLKGLPSQYPVGVQRYRWYSQVLQQLFGILSVHQVAQACIREVAQLLGFPVVEETQDAWQDTRAHRAERAHQRHLNAVQREKITIECASVDEVKIGQEWGYTLSDVASGAVLAYSISEQRNELVVRDLIAAYTPTPKALISDGCAAIQAGGDWFGNMPKARCWFHIMQDLARHCPNPKELDQTSGLTRRQLLMIRLQTLYGSENLKLAEVYLKILQTLYPLELLQPLLQAWPQLKLRWTNPHIPGTNNTSEHLYNAIWARERKRVVKAAHRARSWLSEALFRWNHHLIPSTDQTPWQRFSKQPPLHWLTRLSTPLRYPIPGSTDF